MMMKKLTLFTRYAANGASSRLRHGHWREFLATLAYSVEVTPFFSENALNKFYADHRHPAKEVAAAYRRRLAALRQKTPYAVIEYEALPFFPAWLERLFLRGTRYVLDFDDDVWTKYEKIPFLRGKFDALICHAAGVTVANHALREKVAPLNKEVLLLPTPIGSCALPQEKNSVFTLVWIGSGTTRKLYLEPFAPVLRQLAAKLQYELLVIADAPPALPGVPYRFEAWSETAESLLDHCHAGIMPLADDAFARGKSAYKLIQYLGAGLPAVASPVGENRFVLREGETGFFASTAEEWCKKIIALATDKALYEKMSATARLAAKDYTRDALWGNYRDFLCRVFEI